MLVADPAYARLKSFVIEATGLAYYETRDDQLAPLLKQRVTSLGRRSCDDYLAYLHKHEDEVDRLVCDLTIGETHFFRHTELFDALRRRILPEVLRDGEWPLRIWSAGCSIGAEAYSMSIMLRRELPHLVGSRRVTIIGSDINRRFLERARAGRFGTWALRGVPQDVIDGCFRRVGNEWELLPAFKEGVTFRHHNLVSDAFPAEELTGFDIVLCRNVMIYFEPAVIRRLLQQFSESVIPGGWLLLGHADPGPDAALGFEPVYTPGAVLFRRRDSLAPPPAPTPVAPKPQPKPKAHKRQRPAPAPHQPEPVTIAAMRARFDRGDWDGGVTLCQRAIEQDPFGPAAYYLRALAAEQTGKLDEAERELRRLLYLARDHALAHFELGRLVLRAGRTGEAGPLLHAANRLLAGRNDDVPAGDESDVTVGELRALVTLHAKEAHG